VRQLNADPRVDGILVQLPLPTHVRKSAVLQSILPGKDVDAFLDVFGNRQHRAVRDAGGPVDLSGWPGRQ